VNSDTSADNLGQSVCARLEAAASLLTRHEFLFWHYGDSIGFEGLLATSDVLSSHRYEGFVHGALKAWSAKATPYRELDNTAPGHAMCLSYERTGDATVLAAASELAEFLVERPALAGAYVSFKRAPLRMPYGNAALSAEEAKLLDDPGPGIFVDCLHFDAPFLTHLGALRSDRRLLDLGAAQATAMIALLQDDDTGLFWHFWLEKTADRYGFGWGRGQGWALLGLMDVLDYLPAAHPERLTIATAATRLAHALRGLQHPTGHWPAVVSEPDSYLETSTALFAAAGFARGVCTGLLDDTYRGPARAAWRAALEALGADGAVAGISAAVWASTAPAHYRAVPSGFIVPWGQGTILVAARAIAALMSQGQQL
jgi:unsaturated rhamnogalacturonyl hydrolase